MTHPLTQACDSIPYLLPSDSYHSSATPFSYAQMVVDSLHSTTIMQNGYKPCRTQCIHVISTRLHPPCGVATINKDSATHPRRTPPSVSTSTRTSQQRDCSSGVSYGMANRQSLAQETEYIWSMNNEILSVISRHKRFRAPSSWTSSISPTNISSPTTNMGSSPSIPSARV